MKIKDIMSTDLRTCTPRTNLAAAAALMLDGDCGFLPVIEDGKLAGVVTDRDMFIALATRNKRASDIMAGDVARKNVFTCGPEDDVESALAVMKDHRVRRLPVAGFGNTVVGVISMNDVARSAGPRQPVRSERVVETLQAVCAPRHAVPHVVAV